jgi:hypothetical protein
VHWNTLIARLAQWGMRARNRIGAQPPLDQMSPDPRAEGVLA